MESTEDALKAAKQVKNLLEGTDIVWQDLKVPERLYGRKSDNFIDFPEPFFDKNYTREGLFDSSRDSSLNIPRIKGETDVSSGNDSARFRQIKLDGLKNFDDMTNAESASEDLILDMQTLVLTSSRPPDYEKYKLPPEKQPQTTESVQYTDPTAPQHLSPHRFTPQKKKGSRPLSAGVHSRLQQKGPGTTVNLPEKVLQDAAAMKIANLPLGSSGQLPPALETTSQVNPSNPTPLRKAAPDLIKLARERRARSTTPGPVSVPLPGGFYIGERLNYEPKQQIGQHQRPKTATSSCEAPKQTDMSAFTMAQKMEEWALARSARESETLFRQDSSRKSWNFSGPSKGRMTPSQLDDFDEEVQNASKDFRNLASAYHGKPIAPMHAQDTPTVLLRKDPSTGDTTAGRIASPAPKFRGGSPFKVFEDGGLQDEMNYEALLGERPKTSPESRKQEHKEVASKAAAPAQDAFWALKQWQQSDRVQTSLRSIKQPRNCFTDDSELGLIQFELASRRRDLTATDQVYIETKLERSFTMRLLKAAAEHREMGSASLPSSARKKTPIKVRPTTAPPQRAKSLLLPGSKKKKKKVSKPEKKTLIKVEKPAPLEYKTAAEFMEKMFPKATTKSPLEYEQKLEIEAIKTSFAKWGMEAPVAALEKALVIPSDRPTEVCIVNLKPQGEGLTKDVFKLEKKMVLKKKKQKKIKRKKKKSGSRSPSPSKTSRSPSRSKSPTKSRSKSPSKSRASRAVHK